MLNIRFRSLRLVVCILALSQAFLPGCSLTNPYVGWQLPSEQQVPAKISLLHAIMYAKNAQDRYREALGDRATLINVLGPGVITLGAIVLGQAAYGAHKDAILGTALGGGTGYLIGNWFSNKQHEIIYLAGMEAMSCAVAAVLPLDFSEDARKSLNNDIGELNKSISAVSQAIGKVQGLIPQVERSNPTVTQQARADVAMAEKVVETADKAYIAGQKLLREVDSAGTHLYSAVNDIGVLVNKALQQTHARLESLVNIISQLSKATEIFAPGLGLEATLAGRLQPKKKDGKTLRAVETAEEDLQQALETLAEKAADLASWTRRVAGVVNSVNEQRPLQTLKDCGVPVTKIETDITVSPTLVQFTANTEDERLVIVQGGTTPYSGKILESQTPGIKVDIPIAGDRVFRVKTDKTATQNTYTLLVWDAAKHEKTVTIKVVAKEKDGEKPPDQRKFGPTVAGLGKAEVARIQVALCFDDKGTDGIWGNETQKAFENWRVKKNPNAPKGQLSENEKNELLRLTPKQIADQCK